MVSAVDLDGGGLNVLWGGRVTLSPHWVKMDLHMGFSPNLWIHCAWQVYRLINHQWCVVGKYELQPIRKWIFLEFPKCDDDTQ